MMRMIMIMRTARGEARRSEEDFGEMLVVGWLVGLEGRNMSKGAGGSYIGQEHKLIKVLCQLVQYWRVASR